MLLYLLYLVRYEIIMLSEFELKCLELNAKQYREFMGLLNIPDYVINHYIAEKYANLMLDLQNADIPPEYARHHNPNL